MSRKVIGMNTEIFSLLDDYCNDLGVNLKHYGKPRHIASTEEEDKFSSSAKLLRRFSPDFDRQTLVLEYEGSVYFCFIGFQYVTQVSTQDDFYQIDLDAGILTTLCHQAKLRPKPDKEMLREILDVGSIGDGNAYPGHDFTEFEKLFPEIVVFESKETDVAELDLIFLKFCLAERLHDHSLIDQRIINGIEDLISLSINELPFDTIARSILDTDPGSLFLALYRCFEAVYSVKVCRELAGQLGSSSGWEDVSAVLEGSLNWRPKEQESLAYLFTLAEEASLGSLIAATGNTGGASSSDAAAKSVYGLRCKLVHFRPAMKLKQDTETVKWHDLYDNMLLTLKEVYVKMKAEHLT